MVALATLSTLAELQQEMARTGRPAEAGALDEAVRVLRRSEQGLLTTGQAADRLGVRIPTVKRWIERGVLDGGRIGGRWLVPSEGVERLLRVRRALLDLDSEGNPTPEEMLALRARAGVRA